MPRPSSVGPKLFPPAGLWQSRRYAATEAPEKARNVKATDLYGEAPSWPRWHATVQPFNLHQDIISQLLLLSVEPDMLDLLLPQGSTATFVTALSLCMRQAFPGIVTGKSDDNQPGMPETPAGAALTYYGLGAFQLACALLHGVAPKAVSTTSL